MMDDMTNPHDKDRDKRKSKLAQNARMRTIKMVTRNIKLIKDNSTMTLRVYREKITNKAKKKTKPLSGFCKSQESRLIMEAPVVKFWPGPSCPIPFPM